MKKHSCKLYPLATLAVLALVPQKTYAQDSVWDADKWEISVGGGAGYGPKYEGSDEMEFDAFPYISIEWNELVFLSPGDGLGIDFYRGGDLEASASIGYDSGREEGDDRKNLNGLGDVDDAVTANLSVEYELGPVESFIGISRNMGGTDGLQVEIGVEGIIPLALLTGRGGFDGLDSEDDDDDYDGPHGPAIMLGLFAEWVDDNHAEGYFGVNAAQSARSGLVQYTAESGFKSVGAEVGLLYPITDSWSVVTLAEYSQLVGDAADSPVVKDKNQFSGGMFLSYRF